MTLCRKCHLKLHKFIRKTKCQTEMEKDPEKEVLAQVGVWAV
jgi:hypothetical protein